MSNIDSSKQKLSEAFNYLEAKIDERLKLSHISDNNVSSNHEMIKKINQSLLEQNTALQKRLFELEKEYHELQNLNRETSSQIDDIILNLKNLLVEK